MDIAGLIFGQLITWISLAGLGAGVYKLFQIHKELGEIKEVLRSGRRSFIEPAASAPVPVATQLSHVASGGYAAEGEEDDAATAYAEQLLRAVNAESQRNSTEVK